MHASPDTIAMIAPEPQIDPYGSLRLGMAVYQAAFEAIGCRTQVFDLAAIDRRMVDALAHPRVRAIFSDGGWINGVRVNDIEGRPPLVDFLGKPSIILINDNPCSYWMDRILARDRPRQSTFFIDFDFSNFWGRWADAVGTRDVYVPACPDLGPPPPDADRPIDLLTVVSLRDPNHYRDLVRSHFTDPIYINLFNGITETALAAALYPFSVVCDEVCRILNVELDYRAPRIRQLIFAADYYVRNRRRWIMLERLAKHPIFLVGCAADAPLHPETTVTPPLPHAQLLDLYRQAKTVVVAPPYSGGVTERIVQPMAAGTLIVAPPTRLSDALLGRDRLFVACAADFSDLDACLDRAFDPAFRRDATRDAHAFAARRFAPAASVRRFLREPDADPLSPPINGDHESGHLGGGRHGGGRHEGG